MPLQQNTIDAVDPEGKTQSSLRRIKTAILWILVLGLELYALLWDVPVFAPPPLPRSLESSARLLGEIRRTEREVKIQSGNDVLWDRALAPGAVYSGTRIMTLEQSSAEIHLQDRGTITLDENTLVALEAMETTAEGELSRLKLLRGDMILKAPPAAKPITLEFPRGEKISVSAGTEVRTQGDRIQVVTGEISNPLSGEKFQAGQVVELTQEGIQAATQDLAPEASPSPSPSPSVSPSPSPSPRASPTPRPRKLKPPEIKNPTFRYRKKTSYILRSLNAFAALLIPSANAEEPKQSKYEPLDIELQWKPVPGAKAYFLQIARDRGFKSVVLEEDLVDARYTWAFEPGMENSKGRVFYRVGSVNEAGRVSAYSTIQILVIPEKRKPAPPVAIKPSPSPSPTPPPPPKTYAPLPTRHQVTLGGVFSKTNQSTVTRTLESVDESGANLHELLTYRSQISREWLGRLEIEHRKWRSDSATHEGQPDLTAIDGAIHGFRTYAPKKLTLRWGAGLERSSRFKKLSRIRLDLESGMSLGPAIEAHLPDERLLAMLSLPVSGLLTDSFFGARLNVQRDFDLGKFLVIPELRLKLYRWDSPHDTEVREWSIACSLGYRF